MGKTLHEMRNEISDTDTHDKACDALEELDTLVNVYESFNDVENDEDMVKDVNLLFSTFIKLYTLRKYGV